MKHDLQAFSRDIMTLIKTRGDSGGSGDMWKKSLRHNDFFVPTRDTIVSPLKNEWGQSDPSNGDRKSEQSERVSQGVPTVPTATAHFERGPALEVGSSCPAEWQAILTELSRLEPVHWLPPSRWSELISDAETFLTRWGKAAQQLGWTALNLFGVRSSAPAARIGCWGLILFVQGGHVIALTDSAATIRRRSGAVLTYRRADQADAILISEAQ